jgi:hypothetical protein
MRQRRGEMHLAAAGSVQCATDPRCVVGVYKQCLAEVPVDDEVKVLLEEYLMVCVVEQVINYGRSVVAGERPFGLGLGEVVQAMSASAINEVAEVARRVEYLQFLVQKVVVACRCGAMS